MSKHTHTNSPIAWLAAMTDGGVQLTGVAMETSISGSLSFSTLSGDGELQRSAAWAAEAFRLLFMTSSACCCCATSRRYRFTFQGQRWEAVIADNEFVYATIGNFATEESVTRQALD